MMRIVTAPVMMDMMMCMQDCMCMCRCAQNAVSSVSELR